MNSGCAAALDRLQDFCFMAIKAANREPCTPPRSTLILTPAFVVYTELGLDPHFVKYIQIEAKSVNGFASICVVSLTNLLKSITFTSLKLNIRGFQFRITGLAFIIK